MSEKEQSPYDLCAGWHVSLFIVFFFFYFVTWKSRILFQDIQISTSHQWNVQVFQSVGAMSEKEQLPYDLCASWHVSLFVVFFFFYFVPVSPCAVGQVFFCFVIHIFVKHCGWDLYFQRMWLCVSLLVCVSIITHWLLLYSAFLCNSRRWLRSLLYLCYVFQVLINSLVCWFCCSLLSSRRTVLVSHVIVNEWQNPFTAHF